MTGASKSDGLVLAERSRELANSKVTVNQGLKETEQDEGLDIPDWKVGKRPFLKRGSGLFRFFKNGQCTSAERAKRRSLTEREQSNSPETVETRQEGHGQDNHVNSSENPISVNGNETPSRKQQGMSRNNTGKSVHFENQILTPEESFISQGRQEEEDDLHLFEALEKATGTSSFCSTSSLAARFLQMKLSANEEAQGNTECESMFSDAMSSTISSLHDSDDDDLESHNGDVIVINDEDLHVLKDQLKKLPMNGIPKAPISVTESTNSGGLHTENLEMKSRIKFLEDKLEKVTLEWWSYKDQMIEILHGMQSKLAKVEIEHESSQTLLMKKIEILEAEVRAKSQKWCESQVEIDEKVHILEEEQKFATQKWEKNAKKLQKGVDNLQLELGRKFIETTASIQVMNEKYERLAKEREKVVAPLLDPSLCDPPINLTAEPRSATSTKQSNETRGIDQGNVVTLESGDTEVTYLNGTKKIISRDESEVRHMYTNGDIRVLLKDGTIKYYYADSSTWHTTYSSGAEFFEFSSGQTEKRNPNGMVETVYPNGCVKYTHPTGTEECIFTDNTVLRLNPNGEKEIVLPNGQQEIHAPDYKKRIYPDGTYKIVYNDGSQETRYPNGRVRIKNDKGVLMADVTVKSKPDKL